MTEHCLQHLKIVTHGQTVIEPKQSETWAFDAPSLSNFFYYGLLYILIQGRRVRKTCYIQYLTDATLEINAFSQNVNAFSIFANAFVYY